MVKVIIDGESREVGLREAWAYMSEEAYMMEVRKAELDYFRSTNAYCGSCGSRTVSSGEISVRCPGCGREIFPSLSPAIVVLVRRGDKALLVHAANFKKDIFALVAGFVETGESLEQCVAREVKEETSLEINNIRYFGSQSWPFPSQLMIGFTADWLAGEIRFADGELTAGGWFGIEDRPQLPTMPSLSRRLINAWLTGELDGNVKNI